MELLKMFEDEPNLIRQKQMIAQRLQVDVSALDAFEQAYKMMETSSTQHPMQTTSVSFDDSLNNLIDRIVNELIDGCKVMQYKNGKLTNDILHTTIQHPVQLAEIEALSSDLQPDLTGLYMRRDIDVPSYIELMNQLIMFEETKYPGFYHWFRQGLDILDLDPVTYAMIECNKNSMGYWLPSITNAVDQEGFFKIPDTTIVKVPLTMLQLTRRDYMSLSKTTMEIVDRWAQQVFELKENKKYFLKTGTYSSKFDFRNAKVVDSNEIKQIGEYLLYIHFSALQMAHFDLNSHSPVIYGVSTTNEWVVRDFIEDKDNNPCIYHGMPLHTEYRAFVDFDTKEVFGVHPYWDPNVMKNRFDNYSDRLSPDMLHDSIIYRAHEKILMTRYESNKETVLKHIRSVVEKISELSGQWSIDIMQNGDDFYVIDMALAEQSAFYQDVIPENKRRPLPEQWMPNLQA